LKVHAKAYLFSGEASPDQLKRDVTASNREAMVQAFRAGSRNGFFFEMLAAQTLHAASSGTLLAKKPEIDFLLRLAGTSQISVAIRSRGAHSGEPFLLVAAGNRELKGVGDLNGKELARKKLTKTELGHIEKAALLSARRT